VTTVLICDDSRRVRDGLQEFVAGVPGVDRVATASSGDEVLARWELERPDLVLLGCRLAGGSGLDTTRQLLMRHPDANVVMLSGEEDRDQVAEAIASGARGFLVHDVSYEEVCATVANALAFVGGLGAAVPTPELTEREQQVLEGMSQGKSNGEIGRSLYLSEDTVKTHARRLFRKLGVSDRAQAVALGFRHGLVR